MTNPTLTANSKIITEESLAVFLFDLPEAGTLTGVQVLNIAEKLYEYINPVETSAPESVE